MCQLSKKWNFALHAVHINYRLRGLDSNGDEKLVRLLCKKWHIPLSIFAPKVRQTSEDALRTLRYTRFETLRQKLGFSKIAVGHHQNDQAETLLLHLFRGCGTEGMSGMRAQNGAIIRPLLILSRDEILASLKKKAIPFRTDASNETLDYTRNVIRKKILPAIAKNVQPNIVALLAQSAALFADDTEALDILTPKIPLHTTTNTLSFQRKDLLALPSVVQKRVLRNLLFQVRKSQKDIDFGHIFELQKALASTKNKSQTIAFLGLIYERNGGTVTLRVAKKIVQK